MRTLHLPIADPCHEDWDAMDPTAQGRFCGKCTKQVHDLSQLTESDARALLRTHAGGRICVRYEHDAEGRIRFRAPAIAKAALAGVALAACTPHEHPRREPEPTHSVDVIETPPPIAITPIIEPELVEVMGDMPVEPAPTTTKGEVRPLPPPEIQVRKGDVAVPNEPCDPPAVAADPPPVRPRMGKPVLRDDF